MMFRLVALLMGYGLGLIQMAYIVGRLRGIDIREHGSGNSGTTNALRVMGSKAGLVVFLVDMSKAIVAVLLAGWLFSDHGQTAAIYAGLGTILGHCFPFYLRFKGGKGVACYVGMLLAIQPMMGLALMAIGASILIYTRYMSLTSLVVTGLTPLFLQVWGAGREVIGISVVAAALCYVLHRDNIVRLIKGTERQFGRRSASTTETIVEPDED